MQHHKIFILVLLTSYCAYLGNACDENRVRQGCRIREGNCLCGAGCDTEYRYANKRECDAALRGNGNDNCTPNPCLNGGSCLQTLNGPRFTCLCVGTGFYGDRCDKVCLSRKQFRKMGQSMPYECIVV